MNQENLEISQQAVITTGKRNFDKIIFWSHSVNRTKGLGQKILNNSVPEYVLKMFTKWTNKVDILREHKILKKTLKLDTGNISSKLSIFPLEEEVYEEIILTRKQKNDPVPEYVLKKFTTWINKVNFLREHKILKKTSKFDVEDSSSKLLIFSLQKEVYEEIILFSDSITVLGWIRYWRRKFKTFETYRFKKIRFLIFVCEWFYIPMRENLGDICNEGLKAKKKKWKYFHEGLNFVHFPQRQIKMISNYTWEEADFENQIIIIIIIILATSILLGWITKVKPLALISLTLRVWMGNACLNHTEAKMNETKISSIHSYNLRLRDEAKTPQNPDLGGDEGSLTPVVGVGKGHQLPVVEAEENSKRIFFKNRKNLGLNYC